MNKMVLTELALILAIVAPGGCRKSFNIPDPLPAKTDSGVVVSDSGSFKKALETVKPGSVVIWADGEYENIRLKVTGNGTQDAPIVFRAQTPGKVVFKGMSSIQLNGSWLSAEGFSFKGLDTSVKGSILTCARGSSHCRFSDCRIDGSDREYSEVDTKWVSLYGRSNEVSHCSFMDKRNMGCLLVVWMENDIVPGHLIADNYFTRPYTHYDDAGKARNGQEAIRIGTSDFSMSDAGCTVRGNHFYRCHGERAEIISSKSCANLYEGNLFEESEGSLTLRHGNACTVRGNYFLSGGKSGVGGVRIIGERHVVEGNTFLNLTGADYKSALCVVTGESDAALNGYWTAKDCTVRNNLFVDCQNGFLINYGTRSTQDSAPENLTIEGNTVISSKSSMVSVYVVEGTPAGAVTWKDNVIYGGTQKGVKLDTVDERPAYQYSTQAIESIRKNAGVNWK